MFIEDDDLAVEEAASAIQTRCLGRKQSTACWLPELRPDVAADAGVVCAGTWDEAENELALWSVVLRGGPTGGGAEMEVEGGGPANTTDAAAAAAAAFPSATAPEESFDVKPPALARSRQPRRPAPDEVTVATWRPLAAAAAVSK